MNARLRAACLVLANIVVCLTVCIEANENVESSEELMEMIRHKRDVDDNLATVSNSSDGVHVDATNASDPTTTSGENILENTNNTTNYSSIQDYVTTSPGVRGHTNEKTGDNKRTLSTDTLPASAAASTTTEKNKFTSMSTTTTDGSGEYEQQEPAAPKQLNAERYLQTHLLSNYTRTRPVGDWRKSVNVSVAFYLSHIIKIDSPLQLMSTSGWLEIKWTDEYLTWGPDSFDGLSQLLLPASAVWLPDVQLSNSIEDSKDVLSQKQDHYVYVSYNGMVSWSLNTRLKTACAMDMSKFPFDKQSCKLRVGTISSPDSRVKLSNEYEYVHLDGYQMNEEWQILKSTSYTECVVMYEASPDSLKFCDVIFQLTVQRRSGYYMLTLIVPVMVLVILSLTVFKIPVQAGERVTMSVILLVSIIAFLVFLMGEMPGMSTNFPIFGIYLCVYIILKGLALVCSIFVLNQHHKQPVRPVPYWVRLVVLDCLGALCGNSGVRGRYVITKPPSEDKAERDKDTWIKLMQRTKADTVLPMESSRAESPSFSRNRRFTSSSRPEEDTNSSHQGSLLQRQNPELVKLNGIMCEILVEVRRARRDMMADEVYEEAKEQWHAVAQIMDSILFSIFSAIVFIGCLLFPLLLFSA